MSARSVALKSSVDICPCPACGNRTHFNLHSERGGEDFCEVWLSCICGQEPPSTFRAEDIWGGLSVPMLVTAIDQWNSWQRAPLPGQGTELDMELIQE